MRTRQEMPAFIFYMKVNVREYRNLILKLRQGAMNVWQNVQQLHGAMMHIFDNDTSGEIRSIWNDGETPMWAE